MRPLRFGCLFVILAGTFMLAQSNPVSPINRSARALPSMSASQLSSGRIPALAGNAVPVQTQELSIATAVSYDSGGIGAQLVDIGDLGGSSKPDILATNVNSGTVGVSPGNGNGTFKAPVVYGPEANLENSFDWTVAIREDLLVSEPVQACAKVPGAIISGGYCTCKNGVCICPGIGSTGTANPQGTVAEPVSTGNGDYFLSTRRLQHSRTRAPVAF